MMRKVSVIAGGAGFIGVNLANRLLSEGGAIVIIDNMSRGSESNVVNFNDSQNKNIIVIKADCSKREDICEAFLSASKIGKIEEVWHLAANSDIPAGVNNSDVDFVDTFLTTHQILHAMKRFAVLNFNFASSSAVYGDLGNLSLHENIGPLLPISNYGAMKLASEGLASAAAESFLSRVNIFRFPNVVGVPATHGVILDFINKLKVTPDNLNVLGNGSQQKSYLHVSDLVSAMLTIRNRQFVHDKRQYFNIGPLDDGVTVRWIAEQVVARVNPRASITFGSEDRGWVGDVPKFNYMTKKIQALGWAPTLDSAKAIKQAINEIANQLDV
jgi:UDP-glucose 4-epimerase